MAILKAAVGNAGELQDVQREFIHEGSQTQRKLTIAEIAEWVRSTGFSTPAESVQMIREDRDR